MIQPFGRNDCMKKFVIILIDGAADLTRVEDKTPLELAETPNIDFLAKNGVNGLMKTLYDDLPKGSIVSQLGIFGYDPYKYYPFGRASSEAMALDIDLNDEDLAFRANLSYVKNDVLESYNANYIKTENAVSLVEKINNNLKDQYPNFELYHNSDFRNVLVVRNSGVHPLDLDCYLPHENTGESIHFSNLIKAKSEKSKRFAKQLNNYVQETSKLLVNDQANVIIPWSPSSKLRLPKFSFLKKGKCGFISHMDFLEGIAKAGGVDFFKSGNGSWDTDYLKKGKLTIDLLKRDYCFVCCHINGPDEAAHMEDLDKKIFSIEQIDRYIVSKIIEYFKDNFKELGGVIVTTDHYTNTITHNPLANSINGESRVESHSTHPVPFTLWNNSEKDNVFKFSEDAALKGKYSNPYINHLDLLKLFK